MKQRYEALLEHARDIILFIGETGQILDANRAAAHAYGYSPDELRALSIRDIRAPDTRPEIMAQMARAMREGLLFETYHRRKDGSLFPVEVSSKSMDEGALLISVIRDITERKRAEQALQKSHAELEERVNERTRLLEEANQALRQEIGALAHARSVIESQSKELLDLSVPVLSLWEGLLLCPMFGPLDGTRVTSVSGRILVSIVERSARILLLDVTGVSKLDEAAVRALFDVISSVRLVGASVIVTGIRASAAMELATSGLDVSGLSTYSTLAKGLREAMRRASRTHG